MLAFQTYLWHAAITSPRPIPGLDYSLLHFALYEIPLVALPTSAPKPNESPQSAPE
ncbi:hypothetical protein BH09VER1_BH09VER1_06650 [soil metagenome]